MNMLCLALRLCVCVDGSGLVRGVVVVFFLMIRRPPRSTLDRSSAASDVYKRQPMEAPPKATNDVSRETSPDGRAELLAALPSGDDDLSLIHISEPTRPY